MRIKCVLHLGGIHVFTAGNDHILDTIVDEQIAVFIKIARIARQQPTVVAQCLGRRLRVLPISQHIRRCPDGHFADLATLYGLPIRVEHSDFTPHRGPPGATHPLGSLWYVVLWRKYRNCASRFRHAIALYKLAADDFDGFFQ